MDESPTCGVPVSVVTTLCCLVPRELGNVAAFDWSWCRGKAPVGSLGKGQLECPAVPRYLTLQVK